MQLTRTTDPTVEPVTLTEAKTHLRVSGTTDDTYISALIQAARETTENITNRVFVSQTWKYYLDCFPYAGQEIVIPRPPLISVTSIEYYDESDVLQTWSSASYTVDTDSFKGRVYPIRTASYPSARIYPKSVIVTYVAGYEDSASSPVDLADNVPAVLKQAMLILIAHLYENRESVVVGTVVSDVPMSYQALISPYRVFEL